MQPTSDEQRSSAVPSRDTFATTEWSDVLAAREGTNPRAVEALGCLYVRYYFPLYAFVRRRGYDQTQAEDLTQGFFARLLQKNLLKGVVREGGKFRAFLLTAIKHYLLEERDRATAQKRGGGQPFISLPCEEAETRYCRELVNDLAPDKLFQRKWIITLLESVFNRLRQEYVSIGELARFELLCPYLVGDRAAPSYLEVSNQLRLTEGAVKSAVHRLRIRHSELLKEELLRTVASPEDLREEVEHLLTILNETGA